MIAESSGGDRGNGYTSSSSVCARVRLVCQTRTSYRMHICVCWFEYVYNNMRTVRAEFNNTGRVHCTLFLSM